MRLTYPARLVRQTKNYLVYEYGVNANGNPFVIYIPKGDLPADEQPPKTARLMLVTGIHEELNAETA